MIKTAQTDLETVCAHLNHPRTIRRIRRKDEVGAFRRYVDAHREEMVLGYRDYCPIHEGIPSIIKP